MKNWIICVLCVIVGCMWYDIEILKEKVAYYKSVDHHIEMQLKTSETDYLWNQMAK